MALREWEPGDGLTCSYAKSAPVDLPCGKPVMTAVSTVSAGPRRGDRIMTRALCEHHARGRVTGETPGKVAVEAKKVASQRLIHEHWDEYQRYVAEAVSSLTARAEPEGGRPVRAPAFVRRLIERIGTALDPAENELDDGLSKAPEVVVGFDGSREGASGLVVAEKEPVAGVYRLRYFTPNHPTERCGCGRPAVQQVLIGWKGRRLSEVAPEAILAWVCEAGQDHAFATPEVGRRFPRSDRPVDEL